MRTGGRRRRRPAAARGGGGAWAWACLRGCELVEIIVLFGAALPTYIKEGLRILLGVSPKPTRTLRGLVKGKPLFLAFYFPHGKETGVPVEQGVPLLLSFPSPLDRPAP